MLPAAVDGWLAAIAERSEGRVEPALVRLSLAVTRWAPPRSGRAGDDEGVDAAAARFASTSRV